MKITSYKANPQTLIVTNSSTTVPVRMASQSLLFRKAWFQGKKAAQTANTGNVFFGESSTNGAQSFTLATGAIQEIEAPVGAYLDFQDFWLDVANANDGIVALYVQ